MRLLVCLLVLLFSHHSHAGSAGFYKSTGKQRIDSIINSFRTVKSDTARIRVLVSLTKACYDLGDYKRALIYNEYVRRLSVRIKGSSHYAEALEGKRGEANYYCREGDIKLKRSNYRESLSSYFSSLNLFNSIGDKANSAILLSNIASAYAAIGNYGESLKYSFKALKIQEALGDEKLVAVELNNIGALYNDIHNNARSLEYNIKARNISLKINDKKNAAIYTGNIGTYYQKVCDSAYEAGNIQLSLKFQRQALDYYFKSYHMSEEVGDNDNIAVSLENIGIIYLNDKDYKNALGYFFRALDLYKQLGLKGEQSFCLTVIGEAYEGLRQEKKAEDFYQQALSMAEKTHSNYFLMRATEGNSVFYEKIKQPAKALAYYKEYINYRDSIYNKENTSAITRSEMNYEFEKKEAAVKFSHDKIVYQLENDNKLQKQWRLFFIIVIALALILLFFVKRAYDNKKRLAILLEAEDHRKDILLQEVHHRINNNLQIISSLLTLQANNAENEKLTEYLVQSQNRIQSLSALHELLYDTNSPLDINMKDYIDKVLDFHREVLSTLPGNILMTADIEEVKFPTKLAVPLALIINELVTNSIKYAFKGLPGGLIKITLGKNAEENNWYIAISDNGRGLPIETQRRKDSLGLKLVTIMTKQIGGTFVSENTNGAFFSVIFNLTKTK